MIFSTKTKDNADQPSGTTTIIGGGLVFTGDISGTSDIRIDGTVKGNIHCSARVLVGASGNIEGDVDCRQADIMGSMKGNIKVKEILNLRGSANLQGDIFAGQLQIEPSAVFNGNCKMVAAIAIEKNLIEMGRDKHEQPKVTVAK